MANTPFHVEILTPEGKVFDDEVAMVSTRTSVGSIGVLANHTPLLAMLDACELRLHAADGTVTSYAQGEGYLQVGGNHAMLLVEEAIAASDIDRADLEAKLAESKAELGGLEADSESARAAQRDIRRYEAFLAVGKSE